MLTWILSEDAGLLGIMNLLMWLLMMGSLDAATSEDQNGKTNLCHAS